MMQVGRAQGMVSLNDALAELVKKGLITPTKRSCAPSTRSSLEMLLKRR